MGRGKDMFKISKTFRHESGFQITPIEMQGAGYVFLPKEIEDQVKYENLSDVIRKSESFSEGKEYLVLKENLLSTFKAFLNKRNDIPSVVNLKHCRSLIILTEIGLKNLLSSSRKSIPNEFREWVINDVFSGIRTRMKNSITYDI